MITRRDWLKATAAAVPPSRGSPRPVGAGATGDPDRAIPGTRADPRGGLELRDVRHRGTERDYSALREVLSALWERRQRLRHRSGYGASEEVAGTIAKELGSPTRCSGPPGERGGRATRRRPAAARAQIERSFERIGKRAIDLIQVHNMGTAHPARHPAG